jgi:3-hydroxymyristoyl/3-hydroxydecanoyl-(acyl carrier protein) dehydratase
VFLFVDRILGLEPGKRTLGVTRVTPERALPRAGGPPELPSCLVGEALGQLCAWNAMHSLDFALRPVAGLVGGVTILGRAAEGDTVLLESTIDELSEESVAYHAVATVGGSPILTLENTLGPMLPMEEFIDGKEVRGQFAAIHRPGSLEQALAESAPEGRPAPVPLEDLRFDRIVSRETGREIVAEKTVMASAPYLRDHFPRKPVFPLSLLLECLLDLGGELLGDRSGSSPGGLRPARLRSVKMSQFVPPGDTIAARLQVKDLSEDGARLAFRCEVEGRRACLGQAEFAGRVKGDA